MEGLDLETIRHALEVAKGRGLSEVQIRLGDEAFYAVLEGSPGKPSRPSGLRPSAHPAQGREPELPTIPSPFVGYYRASDPPLRVGQRVEQGEIVASIAALGLAHDVESPCTGEVVELLVKPGEAVEYGQPLAVLKGV